MLTRRGLARRACALALAAPAPALAFAEPAITWEMRGRALRWLTDWDAQGEHRTAGGADQAAADWLSQEAAALGGAPEYEVFDTDLLTAQAAYLAAGDLRILGETLYDAPPTPTAGVSGGLGGRIGLVTLGPAAAQSPGFTALRQRGDRDGLVVVTQGGAPGLALLDAPGFAAPYGPPCLQVTSFEQARLAGLAAAGATVRLVVTRRRAASHARNVVVRLGGQAKARPLVVLTPRSAWWRAAGERGGGLVCWLESLRALLAATPARPVLLAALSGHELGGSGFAAFLARRPGLARQADFVLLGDNIGAAGGRLALAANDDALRAALGRQIAASEAVSAQDELATAGAMGAMAATLRRAGGRYVMLGGQAPLFHLPQDRLPAAVAQETLVRLAAACARAVAGLAAGG